MISRLPVALLGCCTLAMAQNPPQSTIDSFEEQTRYYLKNTFDIGSLLIPALPAGIILLDSPNRYPNNWKHGGQAFGRNFGDGLATELAAKTGKYIAASVFHEDPRYFPSASRNGWLRLGHAIAFTFVDQSQDGHRMVAFSNVAGSFAGGFVSRAYLPAGYNDNVHALQRTSGTYLGYVPTLIVGYMTGNIAEEFKPELKHVAKKLHIPFVH